MPIYEHPRLLSCSDVSEPRTRLPVLGNEVEEH